MLFQVSFGDGYAGSAKIAILSSEQLMKKGYDLRLFASVNSLTERRARERRINVISINTSSDFKTIYNQYKKYFNELNPKQIISYHSLDRKLGIRLKKEYKNKFYNIAYRQNITKSAPIIGSFIYNKYFDYQVACSNGVAESLTRSGINKAKVITIHNSIEFPDNINEISGEEVRNKYPLNNKMVLGLSTWFHKERKGFDILFKAFSKLDEKFVLLIIGIPDNQQNEVLEYAASFNIKKERIVMPGYVDDIWKYYKAMDIFLLTSRSEGFSLALMEAAAASLPLIASDIPGNDEFIRNGENGFLFKLNDINELVSKINKLSDDKILRIKLGEKAYRDVSSNYRIKNLGDKMDSFLKKLI
jgi:glycosyltransferase involved in cell wall biosynthesis